MLRLTIVWREAGIRCVLTARTYRRYDDRGFGVRFYPADLPLINLQVIDGRVIDTKTKEDIGCYDEFKREITIEKEL